ncbi:MAG: ATP-binding protein, partial [Candidatus Brocadiales bacterium]|nr:ATP-binding protein [Candidatus Bathyanammoxibius sp.]
MEDLSLHVLDIVENSIRAGAKKIEIRIHEDLKADCLEIEIQDDGAGMDVSTMEKALDPFFTTKSVRKVGLGLSLFRE